MTTTLLEIQIKGLEILSRELGPAGLVRFLQQFDSGSGDYTAERFTWLESPGVTKLARRIREQQTDRPGENKPPSDDSAH